MRFRKREAAPTAADAIRPLLYGEVPMPEWPPGAAGPGGEPWATFVRAREAFAAGRPDAAVRDWLAIARDPAGESRNALQAWTFLRAAGVAPARGEAEVVLGVVCEVGSGGGHDVLAVYRDGSARYLDSAGGAAILEEPWPEALDVIRAADPLGGAIGLWDRPALPPLPAAHSRLLLLTPAGFRFGQGPTEALFADAVAGRVLRAAVTLLRRLAA